MHVEAGKLRVGVSTCLLGEKVRYDGGHKMLEPATGTVTYGPERLQGVADVYASLVAAGGHLYVAGRDGTVEVLSTGEKIATVAVNRLEDRFDSSPAIAGNELFLRGYENLYCIAE
jgi:hypothetical protein